LEPEAAPKAPKIFRITLEVADIDKAAKFYAKFLGIDGKRHPGARHYFDCGGGILAVLDPTAYQRCQTQAVSLCTKKLDRGAEASEVARP